MYQKSGDPHQLCYYNFWLIIIIRDVKYNNSFIQINLFI